MSASPRTAYVLLLLMAVCWGGTWPAAKIAVDEVPPFTVAAARFAIATALLALWAATRPGSIGRPTVRDLPLIAAMGATAIALYNACFLYGVELAPASDGAIIVPGLAPIFTVLLGWAAFRDRIGRRAVAGLALALAGLILVVGPAGGADRDRFVGALLFVGGAVCWAVYSVIGKSATRRFGAIRATLYGCAAGTLMLVPLSAAESGWTELGRADANGWASIAYLAVFGTVLGFVFFYVGVSRIGAARATSFALLVPVFGVLSSVLILDERLGLATLAGGVTVVAGLWLVQQPTREETARESRFRPRALQID